MKKTVLILAGLAVLFSLCACTTPELEAEITNTTTVINSDGSVRGVYVEDFSQPYYSAKELQTMVNTEIADYNKTSGEGALTLEECSVTGNTARVGIVYRGIGDYTAYEKKVLYVGTIANAIAAGYDMNVTLVDTKDLLTTIDSAQLQAMSDKTVVIIEKASRVRTYKKIKYMSTDVKKVNDYEVDASENTEYTYLVY